MTSSQYEKFEECHKKYVTSLMSTCVLPCIVDFLKQEKSVDVTAEELLEALQLPKLATDTLPPVVPPVIRSGSRRKKSDTHELSEEEPPEGYCHYQFQRGDKNNKYCGKNGAGGLNYCSAHRGKAKNATRKKQTKKKSTPVKETGLVTKKEEPKEMTMRVNSFYGIADHFIHPDTKFVLVDEEDVICAIAKEEENGELRCLTDEEKLEAHKYSVVTIDDAEKEEKALGILQETVQKIKEPQSTPEEGSSSSGMQATNECEDSETPKEEVVEEGPSEPAAPAKPSNIPILPEIPTVPTLI